MRTSKTVVVNGVEERTYYVWGNNGLAGVITEEHTAVVLYDDDGESIGFSLDGTVFTYVKNLQGDVVRVLDSNGSEVLQNPMIPGVYRRLHPAMYGFIFRYSIKLDKNS